MALRLKLLLAKDPHLIGVLVLTALARVLYYQLWGVRFDESPVDSYLQFIDPELLRHDLLRSVFYLRDQPPLFNLGVGIVLKLFPNRHHAAFAGLFLAGGLLLAGALYRLMARMGVSPWKSAIVTLLLSAGPIAILYENWLFYTYPVAVLLCLGALFVHRWLSERRTFDAALFFTTMALVALIRGLFHPLWFLLLGGVLIAIERGRRRQLAAAALAPCLVLVLVAQKNYFLFHSFVGGKLFQEVNLAMMTTFRLPLPERRELIRQGKLSPLSTLRIYSPIERFYPFIKPTPRSGIPVLDTTLKTTRWANWNHPAYVEVGSLYGKDAYYVLRHYPSTYVGAVKDNVARYMMPSDHAFPFMFSGSKNGKQLTKIRTIYDQALAGQLERAGICWWHWIFLPALLLFAFVVVGRGIWRKRLFAAADPSPERATELTVLYCLFNILYVSLTTILFSYDDHSRYRFKVTPLYCALLGLAAQMLHDAWRARRLTSPSAASGSQTPSSLGAASRGGSG